MTIPAGRYRAKAISAQLGKNQNTSVDQLAVTLKISDGQPCAGEEITYYGYFTTEQSQQIQCKALLACGCEVRQGELDWENFTGLGSTECSITVENREYQGKTHVKVAWINPLFTGPRQDEKPKSEMSDFRSRMKSSLREAQESKSKPVEEDGGWVSGKAVAKKDGVPF